MLAVNRSIVLEFSECNFALPYSIILYIIYPYLATYVLIIYILYYYTYEICNILIYNFMYQDAYVILQFIVLYITESQQINKFIKV